MQGEDRIVVDVGDRVEDPAELPPRSHLERALAELDRTDPWDDDRPWSRGSCGFEG